jgi:RNA polymerase sigma-70 factor (ECF subfamily)
MAITVTRTSRRSLMRATWLKRSSDWWRLAFALSRNSADAEDLVNEAVRRTLEIEPRLRSERDVHNYVRAAIRNGWLNTSRKRKHERQLHQKVELVAKSPVCSALNAYLEVERQLRFQELVDEVLEKMEPEIRRAGFLYLLADSTLLLRQIAEIQGVSVTTAHDRVRRAARMLAAALESER